MTDGFTEFDRVRKELEYYRRQVDEVAAENNRLDIAVSGLNHEVKQRRQGFALLSGLQQSVGAHREASSIFDVTIRAINATLGMDKSVVLVPTDREHVYRPDQWLGFREDAADRFASMTIEPPAEFAKGTGLLLVNKETFQKTPAITLPRKNSHLLITD